MSCLRAIRVLDLSRIFAGPWATQMLADLGADVVKVEHPSGDDVRRMGFPSRAAVDGKPGLTSSFLAVNRGKRSVVCDLNNPDDRARVIGLATRADVLVENFKAGALAKYGLDYASLDAVNPRLVYCAITGYGQSGPYADFPGYDPVFQAMSGLCSVTGVPDGLPGAGPVLAGYSVSDLNAGFYAAIAILGALYHRDTMSGTGQFIDLAVLDAQFAAHSHIAMNYLVSGKVPVRAGAASQINTPWQAFDAADTKIMVAVGNDKQFANLCVALGIGGLAADARFLRNRDRMAHRPELVSLLQDAFSTRDARHWFSELNKAGISCGPINNFAAAVDDPQLHHREMIRSMKTAKETSVPFIANPIRLSDTPIAYQRPPPGLGEHQSEVFDEWRAIGPRNE